MLPLREWPWSARFSQHAIESLTQTPSFSSAGTRPRGLASANCGYAQYLALACRHGTAICHAVPALHGIFRHLRHVEVMHAIVLA
jgi:hypothetical protein